MDFLRAEWPVLSDQNPQDRATSPGNSLARVTQPAERGIHLCIMARVIVRHWCRLHAKGCWSQ
jgi:hypothetical protein